ncbi:uncharacterized protein LOC116849602 [Odontomachus brunneus]|uniref:uncharacterized protein LOC116849602 n=1 Tax=Odontomachus brunneus TaxID=486640 RepID=UPI0013F2B2DD|nr:uncharacterized protein LOC116849602 [Odontomachus brunneus]
MNLFRLSREAARQLCLDLLPYLPPKRKAITIPPELKILTCLSFFASGSYQRRIGQDFLSCMCQASISGTIHSVVQALNQIMRQWIQFPIEDFDIEFLIHCNFPGVIGATDGTHIAIWPPEKEREHLYINRKLYHSPSVMIVSDFNGKILAVNSAHGEKLTIHVCGILQLYRYI